MGDVMRTRFWRDLKLSSTKIHIHLGVSSSGMAKSREGEKTCMMPNDPEDAASKV
jgi:hypothetical protein